MGTSCEAGASTTRTQDGQPSPKQNLRRFAAAFRAESTPGHANPVVPAPIRTPEKPQKRQASFTQQSPETKASGAKRGGSQEPTPRLTRSLNAESRKVDPSHPPLTRTPHVPATAQQKTDTLGSLAPLDACPPCSRKGPFLATCGLKRPRRVKRETTNSRFCGPLGTWGGRWSDSKPNRPQGGGWRVGGVGSRSGLEPNPRGGGGRIQNWSGPVLNRTGRNLLFLLLLFRHHRFQTGFRINPRVLVPTGSEPPKLGAGLGSHSERNRSDSKPETRRPVPPLRRGVGVPVSNQTGRRSNRLVAQGGLAPTQDAMCV